MGNPQLSSIDNTTNNKLKTTKNVLFSANKASRIPTDQHREII